MSGYKCSKRVSPKRPKKQKTKCRPPWNDTITDLSGLAQSQQELSRRRLIHQSKNVEKARLQLLEKNRSNRHMQPHCLDFNSLFECNGWDSERRTTVEQSEVFPRALNDQDCIEEFWPIANARSAGLQICGVAENDPLDEQQKNVLQEEMDDLRSLVNELTKEILFLQGSTTKCDPMKMTYGSYRKTCDLSFSHNALLINPPKQKDLSNL